MESFGCFGCFAPFLRGLLVTEEKAKHLPEPAQRLERETSMTAPGFFDYESAAQLPMPLTELRSMLERFDFESSSDEDVQSCAHCILEQMTYEAFQLTSSPLTSSMAHHCVLQHPTLSKMLAHVLACKVVWSTLPLKSMSQAESVGDSLRKQEIALYQEMKEVLSKPAVLRAVVADLTKAFLCDPAAEGFMQLALYFKGFQALTTYRVAHEFWERGGAVNQNAALMLQSRASELFAVDIHPGASIGNGVMIDHATGVVIGSTAILGNDIMMLHQVTLGASGKAAGGAKRHPTIGSRVVLGAGSIVLGDIAVGSDTTVGARAIVSKDIDQGSTVVEVNKVIKRRDVTTLSAKTSQDTVSLAVDSPDFDYTHMWSI